MSDGLEKQVDNHRKDIKELYKNIEKANLTLANLAGQDLPDKINKLEKESEEIKMGYEEIKGSMDLLGHKIDECKQEVIKRVASKPVPTSKFDQLYKFRWPLVTVILSISVLLFLTGDLSTLLQTIINKD